LTGAFAVGALASGLLALSASNDLQETQKRVTTSDELKQLGEKKDNLTILTVVLAGAGVACAGVSLFFTIKGSSRKSAARAPSTAALRLIPGPGALLVDGRF